MEGLRTAYNIARLVLPIVLFLVAASFTTDLALHELVARTPSGLNALLVATGGVVSVVSFCYMARNTMILGQMWSERQRARSQN